MSDTQENIEKQIGRFLDGEMSPDEELSLNRELIRNPEANAMMDDYRRIDELAEDVLNRVVAHQHRLGSGPFRVERREREFGRKHNRGWYWLVSGAVAAALLALMIPRPVLNAPQPFDPSRVVVQLPPAGGTNGIRPETSLMHNVSSMPPSFKRNTGRDVYGVVGENGSIYWIEVDRIRTVKQPLKGFESAGMRGAL